MFTPIRESPPTMARRLGWLTGLPVAAVACGTVLLVEPDLAARQARTATTVADALASPGVEPWLRITWQGRDARAEGEAPDEATRAAARQRLRTLADLRHLDDRMGLVTRVAPFTWQVLRMDERTFAAQGHRPAEIGRTALAARLVEGLPASDVRLIDDTHAARGAPTGLPEWGAYALGLAAHLAPGGRVTLADTTLALHGRAASPADEATLRATLAKPPAGVIVGETVLDPLRVEPFTWSATRDADSVQLGGFVPSEAARTQLAAAIRELGDGMPLADRTALADGLPAGVEPAAFARLVGEVLGLLAQGRVELADDRLSVSGLAVDAQAPSEIDARLDADLRAAGLRRGTVAVQAGPIAPYRAAIRREPGRVVLSGHLPDAATRDALLNAARTRFFGERILDRTRIAPGAPDGLTAALTGGLDALALLATGEVSVEDRTLTLAGESLYRGTARRLREGLPALPPGWTQTATVRGPAEPERLTTADCRARLAETWAPIRFAPGSADLVADAYPFLDAVASLARLCPQTRVEVAGYADAGVEAAKPSATPIPPGKAADTPPIPAVPKVGPARAATLKKDGKADAKAADARREPTRDAAPATDAPDDDLPRRRALAVVDYLVKAGVPADRALAASALASGSVGEMGQAILGLRL